MTLEEKAGLCSGADFWHTKAVERLGVPASMVSDGPHGLRKQEEKGDHLGVNDSIKAVCFPAASATAASFDPALLTRMGEAIGDACQHERLSVVLGPAVNIKRSPSAAGTLSISPRTRISRASTPPPSSAACRAGTSAPASSISRPTPRSTAA